MNFKKFFSKLKLVKWTYWIGYGTFGSVLISSIIVGVVVATKKNDKGQGNVTSDLNDEVKDEDIVPNNPEVNKKPIIKGKQKPLPIETTNSININNLISSLKTQGVLNLDKAVSKLKEIRIKVNVQGGTSYRNKIIGNKYGDIDRFVVAWNKLTSNQKDELNRKSFAQLFANQPKNKYDIGHQVEYILLNPGQVKKEPVKGTNQNNPTDNANIKVVSKPLSVGAKINSSNILGKLNVSQKTQLDALVNKYIPNGSKPLLTQNAKVFIKNEDGKYINGSEELKKGGKRYPASFGIPYTTKKGKSRTRYYVIWGLFNQKKEKLINSKTSKPIKFKGWETNILGQVDQIAIVNTQKQDRGKTITFSFFKIDNQWIFATDYINYIEGNDLKLIKITINNPKDKNSTEAIMNQKFSDLVTYTKDSLAS